MAVIHVRHGLWRHAHVSHLGGCLYPCQLDDAFCVSVRTPLRVTRGDDPEQILVSCKVPSEVRRVSFVPLCTDIIEAKSRDICHGFLGYEPALDTYLSAFQDIIRTYRRGKSNGEKVKYYCHEDRKQVLCLRKASNINQRRRMLDDNHVGNDPTSKRRDPKEGIKHLDVCKCAPDRCPSDPFIRGQVPAPRRQLGVPLGHCGHQ